MGKSDRQERPVQKGDIRHLFQYKYYFLASLLLCVIMACTYLALRTRNYIVTTRFNIDNKNAALIVKSLKSSELVRGTLNKLSFQVSYYTSINFKSTELEPEKSPVYVQLHQPGFGIGATQLTITLTDQQHYILADQDTTTLNQYGEVLRKPYGTFVVYKGSVGVDPKQVIAVQIDDLESLTSSYLTDLVIIPPDNKKQITIALSHNNTTHSAIFLKSLLKNSLLANPEADSLIYGRLKEMDDSIAMLHKRMLTSGTSSPDLSAKVRDSLKMAINVLKAITPYAQTDAGQFTQIPATYHLADLAVQQLITVFNKFNQDNQHLLSDPESRQALYQNKAKLIAVKSDLLYALNKLRMQNQDLLAGKKISYGVLAQHKAAIVNRQMDEIDRLPTSVSADSPPAIMVLLITMLMSVLIPLPLIYLLSSIKQK